MYTSQPDEFRVSGLTTTAVFTLNYFLKQLDIVLHNVEIDVNSTDFDNGIMMSPYSVRRETSVKLTIGTPCDLDNTVKNVSDLLKDLDNLKKIKNDPDLRDQYEQLLMVATVKEM
jgi:hypothetical protein